MKPLQTPFDETAGLFSTPSGTSSWLADDAASPSPSDLVLPATYQSAGWSSLVSRATGRAKFGTGLVLVDSSNLRRFCAAELDVGQLNRLHRFLWLAGLERPARPLHQQLSIGRRVAVTEAASLHLLWRASTIYVKPLPDFLACAPVWADVLNHDASLHERACGFLLSYLWLVGHRSDLAAAHELGLIPRHVDWPAWTRFARSVAANLDIQTLNGINVRYRHGELRLARINWIARATAGADLAALFRGYEFRHTSYESFLAANLGWLLSAVVYVTVVLTAMQVGLATDALGQSPAFQRASYGFTVFAIVAPVGAVLIVAAIAFALFVFNWVYTERQKTDWSNVSALSHDRTPTAELSSGRPRTG